jgi:class 3 adenylate cyclase
VKTLGDGVPAVFGSASDAVSAAVEIRRTVDRESRAGPVPLAVRVGVALGDVSFEEDDVFGAPVVEAARLVAVATPGQILTTAAVPAEEPRPGACWALDPGERPAAATGSPSCRSAPVKNRASAGRLAARCLDPAVDGPGSARFVLLR